MKINEQLKNLSFEMDELYTRQLKLSKVEDQMVAIFQQKRRLLFESNETWQTGKLHAEIQDVAMKFKQREQKIFEAFEEEMTSIKNEHNRLEEREMALVYERRERLE